MIIFSIPFFKDNVEILVEISKTKSPSFTNAKQGLFGFRIKYYHKFAKKTLAT